MRRIIESAYLINPNIIQIFLALIVFIILDFLWLTSLPKWGISYGPGKTTAIVFTFLRFGFFVIWTILQVLVKWIRPETQHFSVWSFIIPNLLLLCFGIYGFCIEPFHLTQSHIEVKVPGLSRPVRIVQLSDIHVEFTTRREKELPGYVAKFNPDMIVITGDLINETYGNNPQSIHDLRDLMNKLSAPMGIYAVNGNVEPPQHLQMMLEGTQVHVLEDQIVRIPEISPNFVMIGLDYVDLDVDKIELQKLMAELSPDDYSLLLYHKPDLIYSASDLNVDLYLAGHTHGGQVRLPFYGAIFSNSIYGKKFEMGLYNVENTTLFVSRGLGFTGGIAPRIRFLAPPEIVVIDLIPQ